MMHLNIVTPCTRCYNLEKIADSLKTIPKSQRRWIVVFDSPHISKDVPKEAESYAYWERGSTFGNAQRNYALDKINEGWVYFNDDDTTIHPLLWENIKNLENDFISFSQSDMQGNLRLKGDRIELNYVDSHNFIALRSLIGDTRFYIERYNADGTFAEDVYRKSKSPIFIPKVLSIYNSLR